MSWSDLHARLHQTLRSRRVVKGDAPTALISIPQETWLLPPQAVTLVAVSGGQDSQCLLRLLVDLQPKWHWHLHVIHCNHRWRSDAEANAKFVTHQAQRLGLPYTVITADTPPQSEAAARQWRYQVFGEVARVEECTHVVTGHTASDRAETLLFNLVRGSGLDGLQALTWQRPLSPAAPDVSLVRPLLEVTRAETQQFCQAFAVPVWEDATNCDRTYRRNRLRLEVLPILRDHFNPQVDVSLAHTAELLAADVDYLTAAANQQFDQCVTEGKIQRRSLRMAPLALQRRVIRRLLTEYLLTAPHFDHVEKVVALLDAPNRSQTDPFPGGAIAVVNDPWILIRKPTQS